MMVKLHMTVFISQLFNALSKCAHISAVQTSHTSQPQNNVFIRGDEALGFLGRRLLYNRWDFEIFTPGNLERECYEEMCNFEEAREYFEDDKETLNFWKEYSTKGPYAKSGCLKKPVCMLYQFLKTQSQLYLLMSKHFWQLDNMMLLHLHTQGRLLVPENSNRSKK
ncbi:transmembrane gamma-carboxyglutamic acid protein 4 isoform X4 [Narcine bancroftii]|uniref:transmembrane gamma-carboxyglutamic acid protein 4 isoform X4 n=1 Tax=Narcine bancroftii TaxID=1343680 RepID=UPI0038315324